MKKALGNAEFIITEFTPFVELNNPWGTARPDLYQHSNLTAYDGLPFFYTDFETGDFKKAEIFWKKFFQFTI